jgi:hypothetical protein
VAHVNSLNLVVVNLYLAIVLVQQIFNAVFQKVVEVVVPANPQEVHVEIMHVLLSDQSRATAIRLIE